MRKSFPRFGMTILALSMAFGTMAGCKAIDDAKSVYRGEAGTAQANTSGVRARVNGVQATAVSAIPTGWCEKRYEPGRGPKLTLPATTLLNPGYADVAGRPRWINMWATWCKPCVHEMPLIMRWREARLGTGTDIGLELLSIDDEMGALNAFLSRHVDMRSAKLLHLDNQADLSSFATSVGLGADTTVPIHVFTDRDGNITCVRTGGIAESDLSVIRELMK